MKKKICLNGLDKEKVLSPSEMKNVTGGSTYYVACSDGSNFPVYAVSCDDALWGVSYVCDWVAIIGPGC